MKIKDKMKSGGKCFGDLKPGDVFVADGCALMKIDKGSPINAVRLDSGEHYFYEDLDDVYFMADATLDLGDQE